MAEFNVGDVVLYNDDKTEGKGVIIATGLHNGFSYAVNSLENGYQQYFYLDDDHYGKPIRFFNEESLTSYVNNEYQARVVKELEDLEEKNIALALFLNTDKFWELELADKLLLIHQSDAMTVYADVLATRIKRFSK